MVVDVERVARIARLNLTDEEKGRLSKQLNDILDAFSKIDEINIDGVVPSFHPIKIENVFREDEVKKFDFNKFANTKNSEGKYFKGPKIAGD